MGKDIKEWILALAVRLDETISRSPVEYDGIVLQLISSCFIS